MPAFLTRSIQYNPQDGKNLNRVFPGSPDGTITELLAWTISNEIIARCNYVIDVHSGDGNNDLMPYTGCYNYTSLPELSK
ncbi:MAG: succinylglutamate desuccinylase, partial [Sphingobacteriaceae bacterium]